MAWLLPSQMTAKLAQWRGRSIVRMTRLLMDIPESIPSLYAIEATRVFRDFSAPLRIGLSDSTEFVLTVDTSQSSVVLRDGSEADERRSSFRATLDATDPVYSDPGMAQATGVVTVSLGILVRPPKNLRHEKCARESLALGLASGRTLVFSCGLHDGSDDFAILYLDEIPPDLRAGLTSVAIE